MKIMIKIKRFSFSLILFSMAVAPAYSQPKTRVEAINQERSDKRAMLWPERQSPLVSEVNKLVERGFLSSTEWREGRPGPISRTQPALRRRK